MRHDIWKTYLDRRFSFITSHFLLPLDERPTIDLRPIFGSITSIREECLGKLTTRGSICGHGPFGLAYPRTGKNYSRTESCFAEDARNRVEVARKDQERAASPR